MTRSHLFFFASALLILTGCSGNRANEAAKTVNLYIYSEYMDPEIISEFAQKSGYEVRISLYENTEEMLAKLQQAGGVSQYDVVVVSDHAVPVLAKLNLIQKLDKTKIPNAANVDPMFADPVYDPASLYSMPYQWGTVGLLFRKDAIQQGETPSWGWLLDPSRIPGPFVLIDSMRDMLGGTLKYLGYSVNTRNPDELRQAGDLLLTAKKHDQSLGFEGGTGGKSKVLSGGASLAVVWNGDAVKAMDEDPNLAFGLPVEGTVLWTDAMTIPAKAPNAAGGLAFINFILDPRIGAKLSDWNRYATPNAAARPLVQPSDRANPAIYPPDEEVKKGEYLEDIGADTRLYDEVWTSVKSR